MVHRLPRDPRRALRTGRHVLSTRASHRFGKYSVVYRLGAGGMAEVFKCRLSGIGGFNKLVVVKRIRPELVHEPGFVEMFLDEARIAANLAHPNVVQIFEIDQAEGLPYIAMEYVRGPTLALINREEKRRHRPRCAAIARIMAGICAGLHYAHRATDERGAALGIVHRDVSPQNVICSMEGVPKLLDFGVAKARGQLAHTTAGALKGKLKFMAPEQFTGNARITPAVDIFAAGVCLYEATTLHLPYPGENELDVMRAAASGKFPRPSELVPDIDPRLEELILWAMAPNPIDRCPDALALQLALEDYADREHCGQADVARYVSELFPDASGDTQLKNAYVDVESHDILGPPDSVVRHTLALRAQAQAAERERGRERGREPDLGFDVDELPPRRESRAPVWGAVFSVALIAVFALGIALARQRPTVLTVPIAAAATAPSSSPAAERAGVRAAVDPQPTVDTAENEQRALAEQLDQPKPLAVISDEGTRERAPRAVPRSVPMAAKGTLSVETEPLAQLFVNGRALGWSPLERLVLAPGQYRLRAMHGKRMPAERDVRIVAGRDTAVKLVLQEIPAPASAAPPAREPAPEPVAAAVEEPPVPPVPAPAPATEPAPTRRPLEAPARPAPSPPQPAAPSVALDCPDGARLVRASAYELWCEQDGEREGPYLRLWPNGRKAVEGTYRRGKKTGRWLEYFEQGGERARVEWRRGVQLW